MRTFFFLLIVLVSVSGFSQERKRSDIIKDKIVDELRTLEENYLIKLGRRDFQRARNIIDNIYGLLEELGRPQQYAMDEALFQDLKNSLKNEPFRSSRISIIKTAAERNNFTVHQVVEIIELLTFSDERVETLKIVYPWIIDKNNSLLLFNALQFNSEKDELRKLMEEYDEQRGH